jgi:GTP-binding protein
MIDKVVFSGSHASEAACPKDNKPEYAFIGRSNVGKSSLINMLCNSKDLAKVSQTPGKTQTINFFSVDKSWYLVDLPGYGYAKVSRALRGKWQDMIDEYLLTRNQLICVFVLIDSMIPPQASDIEFVNWLGENEVPFVIAYTKTDRLSVMNLELNIKKIRDAIGEHWHEMPVDFITSAERKVGRMEIIEYIEGVNKELGIV